MDNKVKNMENKFNPVISMLRIEMDTRLEKKVFALTRENFSLTCQITDLILTVHNIKNMINKILKSFRCF